MVQIYQAGSINTAAIQVPGLYVSVAKPANLINGVTTSRIGVVGMASWGPVNEAVPIGSLNDYYAKYGRINNNVSDMAAAVSLMSSQGAADFRCVRVTDGTDVAATSSSSNLVARYTGSDGNNLQLSVSYPSPNVCQIDISHPYLASEHYTLPCSGVGSLSWGTLAQAINGISSLVMVSNTTGPSIVAAVYTFSGGGDGGNPSDSVLLGQDIQSNRTGLYALRGMGCSLGVMLNTGSSLTWQKQRDFGLSEGVYMITAIQPGSTISQSISTVQSSSAASYGLKIMHGDWLVVNLPVIGTTTASPAVLAAGVLASISPEQSSLNKPINGITTSQNTGISLNYLTQTYSSAELAALFSAGIDVISYPSPGGNYWSCLLGHNSSSTASNNGDNYTRLTNFIAETLATGMGQYVGAVVDLGMLSDVRATILTFLGNLQGQGILGSIDGSIPYSVVCDASNNPQSRIALGYVQADIAVRYQGINEKFIVNLQGGSNVTVTQSSGA